MTASNNTTPRLMADSKAFNRDFICRIDGTIGGLTLHTAVGHSLMLTILGDAAEKVLTKVEASKRDITRFKPYHGLTISFYYR